MRTRPHRFFFRLLTAIVVAGALSSCARFDAISYYYLGYQYLLDLLGVAAVPVIDVSLISGNTTELGGQATFTVSLRAAPSANVDIALVSSDAGEGTINQSSLTFTTLDWNVTRTITVTGVDDLIADGNQGYTIILSPAVSTDSSFNGVDPADVSVVNLDNESIPGSFTVSAISGNTSESGGTATFTVVLNDAPTASVAIAVSSSNTFEGTVSPATLTFTSGNWNTPQTVTVTGVNDLLVDGNISYTIVLAPAVSSDVRYSGVDPADVTLVNLDNDGTQGGITVGVASGNTTEFGGQATFTVVLDDAPQSDVTIAISSNDTTEGTVSPASLTFTSLNWNVPRTVTVTGVNDLIVDGNTAYIVVLDPAVSADPRYSGLNPADVPLINEDNDGSPGGCTVSAISGMTMEDGTQATFTVVLTDAPAATVTIAVSSDNTNEGTVSPAGLTFDATCPGANCWSTPQTVTVTGADDLIADGRQLFNIVLAPTVSADPRYSGVNPADRAVTNRDDEWFGGYPNRRRITFGTTHSLLYMGYTATFTTDTTLASLASGDDVRIIWHQSNGMALELDRLGSGWQSAANTISFGLLSDIPVNLNEDADGAYFVYYTNAVAGAPPDNEMNVYYFADFFTRANNTNVGNGWTEWDASGTATQDILINAGQIEIWARSNTAPVGIRQNFPLGVIPDDFIIEFDWNIFPNGSAGGETTWYFWMNVGDSATMINANNKTGVGAGLYSCMNSAATDCAASADNIDNDLSGAPLETGITGAHSFKLVVNRAASTYDYYRDSVLRTSGAGFANPGVTLDQIRLGGDNLGVDPDTEYHTMDNIRVYLNPATAPTVAASAAEVQ